MKPNAIAILSKAPIPGSSKTRLCPPFTLKQCASLASVFLKDTLNTASELNDTDAFVYCAPGTKKGLFKPLSKKVMIRNEEGKSLGEKLIFIFNSLFIKSYKNIVVISADCPDLPKEHLRSSFKIISNDIGTVVIGPSSDGAINLIGANAYNKEVINRALIGIDWSPEFSQIKLMNKFKKLNAPVHLLPVWHDIDTFLDIINFLKRNSKAKTHTSVLINRFLSS